MSKSVKFFVFVVTVSALVLLSVGAVSALKDPFLIDMYKGTYTSTGSTGDITLTLNEDLTYTWVCNSGPCENSNGQWEVYLASQSYVYLNNNGSVSYLQDLETTPMTLEQLITHIIFAKEGTPPTPSPPVKSHVGDLDGVSTPFGSRWQATVTVTVLDENGDPVTNATVSGDWSGGYTSTAVCTTDGSGVCSVTSGQIRNKYKDATFMVANVTHATLTYDSTANGDPDGDSNGTTIVALKP